MSPKNLLRSAALSLLVSAPALGQGSPSAADWASFEGAFPGTLTPRFERETGRLTQVLGRARISAQRLSEDELEAGARRVLRQAAPLLGVSADDLHESYATRTGGLLVWQAEQRIDGVPVLGSRVETVLHEDGHLLALRAQGLVSAPRTPLEFEVSASEAGELARIAAPTLDEGTYAWEPRAVVVALDGAPRAAWQLKVAGSAHSADLWSVLVDGASGEVFRIESGVLDATFSGSVDGRGIFAGSHDLGGPPIALPLANLHVSGFSPGSAVALLGDANGCDEEQPQVSSDGTKVAFVKRCGAGAREAWIVGAGGSGLSQLTSDGFDKRSVDVTADGGVVFFLSRKSGADEVWKVNADGTGLTQVTFTGGAKARPRVNDAGTQVVFACDSDGDWEIYIVASDGSGLSKLTDNAAFDGQPDFSGDGALVAFMSRRDGDAEIFVVDADGANETQLTFNAVFDGRPSLDAAGFGVVFQSQMGVEGYAGGGLPLGGGAGGGAPAPGGTRPVTSSRTAIWGMATDGAGLSRISEAGGSATDPDVSGDGTTVVYAWRGDLLEDYEIRAIHMASGAEFALSDNTLPDRFPTTSSDGLTTAWQVRDGGELSLALATLTPGNSDATVTDFVGGYALDLPSGSSSSVSARLRGLFARVKNLAPGAPNLRVSDSATAPVTGVDLSFNPIGDDELRTTQVTAYYHTDLAHDTAASILGLPSFGLPTPLPIDSPALANVNEPSGVHNAFYSPLTGEMTFFKGTGPTAPNTAYDTLVYHEYGHRTDDLFGGLEAFDPCGHPHAQTESLGDVMSMSASGSLVVGDGFEGPGTFIRDYSTPVSAGGAGTRQLDCLDCAFVGPVPEPHDHGEAFAGFYKDLVALVGQAIADELVFATFSMSPPDMNSAVMSMFMRDADPALGLGGSGDPVFAPHYDDLCEAAVAHGFDCWPRPDFGSEVCWVAPCGGAPAVHQTTGTEWLGAIVSAPDGGCDPVPTPLDEDGVVLAPAVMSGETVPVTVTISVNPALLGSERYGGTVGGSPNELRLVYFNAWVFVTDGVGGFSAIEHVLGTGSSSTESGPAGFAPNTLAFDPETFGGATASFVYAIEMPEVPEDRYAFVRFRLDYGEDSGKLMGLNCRTDPALGGPCGPARYGEVEDYQILIVAGP